jgi:hypothetical protein
VDWIDLAQGRDMGVLDWYTGIEATELPLRVYLGLKLAGSLCAAI